MGSFWMQWMGSFLCIFFLCMKNVEIEKWKCGKMTHIFEDFAWYFHVWTSKPIFFCLFMVLHPNTDQIEVIWHCFVQNWKSCSPYLKIYNFSSRKGVNGRKTLLCSWNSATIFLGAPQYLLWENHSGIKSPVGGVDDQ